MLKKYEALKARKMELQVKLQASETRLASLLEELKGLGYASVDEAAQDLKALQAQIQDSSAKLDEILASVN